jgi:hypothetical protein
MSGIPIDTLEHIDNCLKGIGCCIIVNEGPIEILAWNFHPRVVEKPKVVRKKTPRDEVLHAYVKQCNDAGIPAFASGGTCFSCGYDLVDVENKRMRGTTGCPKCHRSLCD